eukprot:gene17468-23692_t
MSGFTGIAAEAELLECARYGETDDLKLLLSEGVSPNHAGGGGNTPLHMASANGFLECVRALIERKATYVNNDNGNSPLHWAVLNKHLEVTKLLMASYPEIDVLAKNGFGKSALTEAFGAGEAAITSMVLEHKSAAQLEKKTPSDGESSGGDGGGGGAKASTSAAKVPSDDSAAAAAAAAGGGGGGDADATQQQQQQGGGGGGEATSAEDSHIIQSITHTFNFSKPGVAEGPDLLVREVATNWDGEVFKGAKTAEADTTGMQVWATSLVFARWVVELQASDPALFAGKAVIELGAGAGVPGIAALMYTQAKQVTMTDLFKHTMENLQHNVDINVKASSSRTAENARVMPLDWTSCSLPAGSFDVILGSDLVYETEAVDALVQVTDHLLSATGTFYMVAGGRRLGVPTLVSTLEARGYTASESPAPTHFLDNPLTSKDDSACQLHFNELEENTFTLYTFKRGGAAGILESPAAPSYKGYSSTGACYGATALQAKRLAVAATAAAL